MLSITACGDLTFHGALYGMLGYAAYTNNSYLNYKDRFNHISGRHDILHARLYRLIAEAMKACKEGYEMLEEIKYKLTSKEEIDYIEYISIWKACSTLTDMFKRVTEESDQIDQRLKEYYDSAKKNLDEYKQIKNKNRWVYNTMASLLTGSTGFFLNRPTFKIESLTLAKWSKITILSACIGVGSVMVMSKCLSYEEKSIGIVTRGIQSNIEVLNRKQYNFIFPMKNDMAADIGDYESLALKIIKYCDIQGNEDRISRLEEQMIQRTDLLLDQLSYIMLEVAPENLASIRFMQYERNPLDLISKTTLD